MRFVHLLILVALWSSGVPAWAQVRDVSELSEAQIQQVMTLIVAADSAREDGRCGEAIAQYREALEVLDADTVRFSLASCLEDVGAVQDAEAELRVVIEQADDELVARAETELARLHAAHPATVLVIVDPPEARVFINGSAFAASGGEIEAVVPPGSTTIRVAADGFVAFDETFTLGLDETRPIRVRLEPIPAVVVSPVEPTEPRPRGLRTASIGMASVALVSLGTGAALRVGHESSSATYARQLNRTPSTEDELADDLSDIERTAETGNRQLRASRAMTGVAVATGVGAVVTGVLARRARGAERTDLARFDLAPTVDGRGRGGVQVGVLW